MKIFEATKFWCAMLATITMVLIMFTVVVDVIARWLRLSLYGVFELNGLLVGISIFLGLAYVQGQKKHIGVTFVAGHISHRAKHIVQGILMLMCTVFFSWMTWLYCGHAYQSYVTKEVILGFIQFPVLPLKLVMALGLLLLSIQFVIDTVDNWIQVFRPHVIEPKSVEKIIELEAE